MVNPTQSNVRATDLHRVFLQSLLSRRVETEHVMVELYKRAVSACQAVDDNFRPTHDASKSGAKAFFKDINKILDQGGMQMELKSLKDEMDQGKEVWALVNLDPIGEAASMTDYEPLQISYFKLVANEIISSYPANSVGSNKALSLTSKLNANMAKSAADVLLGTFVARGWLHKSKSRGRYSLAPRAIMELDNWLVTDYEDYIQKCGRCSKAVLTGRVCAHGDCGSHLHKSCYATLMTAPKPKCPLCNKEFADAEPTFLGEESVSRAEDGYTKTKEKRKRPANGGGKGNGAAGGSDEEDELDDEDGPGSDGEDEESTTRSKKGKAKSGWASVGERKKNKNKKRAVSDSDEEDE